MAEGSVETYAGMLSLPGEVRKVIEKQHADAVTSHAADMCDEELVAAVAAAGPAEQPTMWLMLVTGCHAKDAEKLRRAQVDLVGRKLEVCWHWTKSIVKRKNTQTESYDVVGPTPTSFVRSHAGTDRMARPWNATAARINKLLGKTTSVVFRRALERRLKEAGVEEVFYREW